MEGIVDKLKDYVIPILAGVILFPLKSVFEFKGIIVKDPNLNRSGVLTYPLSITSDSLQNVVMIFSISSTDTFSQDFIPRMTLSQLQNRAFQNNSQGDYSQTDPASRAIWIKAIPRANYLLVIPLKLKHKGTSGFKDVADGVLQVFIENKQGTLDPYPSIKSYQYYDWIFFHPWFSAIALFAILVVSQVVYKKIKKR